MSSGMLHRVALVRIEVSEERIASLVRVKRFGKLCSVLRLLVTVNVAPKSPILVILMMETIRSYETSVNFH
jgi:hypothetical protein